MKEKLQSLTLWHTAIALPSKGGTEPEVFAQFAQQLNGAFYPLKNENSVVVEVVDLDL